MAQRTIAVALKQEAEKAAPKVVASGKGRLADKILSLAFENGIKVRQDQDLAEVLSAVEVDSDVPMEAFAAVAEILEYLYLANDELAHAQ